MFKKCLPVMLLVSAVALNAMEAQENNTLTLLASDSTRVALPRSAALLSATIKEMLDGENEAEVNLPEIDAPTLQCIATLMQKQDERMQDATLPNELFGIVAETLSTSKPQQIASVINALHFLDDQPLFDAVVSYFVQKAIQEKQTTARFGTWFAASAAPLVAAEYDLQKAAPLSDLFNHDGLYVPRTHAAPHCMPFNIKSLLLCEDPLVIQGANGNPVAWSPDGSKIISSSRYLPTEIYDASTGACLITITGHTNKWINSTEWSPDGKHIVTASEDNTAKILDASTGTCIATLSGHTKAVLSATYSPDGKLIVTVSADNTVKVWDAQTGDCIKTVFGHADKFRSVAWSLDGKRIVTTSSNNTAKIWDASTGACLAILDEHTGTLVSAEWSPDGECIVTASVDNTAKIWNASTGECLKTLSCPTNNGSYVKFATWSPDGKYIVTLCDKTAKIWDAQTGDCITIPSQAHSAAWSPDSKHIVTTSSLDGTAKIWDASTGTCIATLYSFANSAAWSPDGIQIATVSGATIRIFDMNSDACQQEINSLNLTQLMLLNHLGQLMQKQPGQKIRVNGKVHKAINKLPENIRTMIQKHIED